MNEWDKEMARNILNEYIMREKDEKEILWKIQHIPDVWLDHFKNSKTTQEKKRYLRMLIYHPCRLIIWKGTYWVENKEVAITVKKRRSTRYSHLKPIERKNNRTQENIQIKWN